MEEYIEAKDQVEWVTEEKYGLIIQGFRFDNFIKPNSEKGEIMKVLVIPDVHLKPYMFDDASRLMRRGVAEKAVCLMDIADDWGQEANLIDLLFFLVRPNTTTLVSCLPFFVMN